MLELFLSNTCIFIHVQVYDTYGFYFFIYTNVLNYMIILGPLYIHFYARYEKSI